MANTISHLYIIGNGFDMHHGIDSSYFEYRMWLKDNNEDLYWKIVNLFCIDDESKESIALLENRQHPWWKYFEKSLGNLDLAEIVDNCVFENYPDISSDEFRDRDYHAAEIDAELQLGKFVDDIKSTFERWISSLNAPDVSKKIFLFKRNSLFISFNYTNTLEKLYSIPTESICYIHGKANNDEELVVGHNKSWEDLMEIADNTPVPPESCDTPEELEEWYSTHGDFITNQTRDVAVREYLKLAKNPSKVISDKQWMFDNLDNIMKIHIYGFSFSDVDLPYIKYLISIISSQALWEISYYSESEKEDFLKIMQSLNVQQEKVSFVKLKDLMLSNLLQLSLDFKNE